MIGCEVVGVRAVLKWLVFIGLAMIKPPNYILYWTFLMGVPISPKPKKCTSSNQELDLYACIREVHQVLRIIARI